MRSKGFTLIEILVVLAILIIMAGIGIGSFFSSRQKYAVEQTTGSIVSALAETRSKTVASKDDSQYGIHFEENFYSLFKGMIYSASDPENKRRDLPPSVRISSILLSGGGADVVFQKISGKADRSGTIRVSLAENPASYREVVIYATGIAEVQ